MLEIRVDFLTKRTEIENKLKKRSYIMYPAHQFTNCSPDKNFTIKHKSRFYHLKKIPNPSLYNVGTYTQGLHMGSNRRVEFN